MQTLAVTGRLTAPLEDGQAAAPMDLGFTINYTQKVCDDLVFASTVTDQAIGLGTLATGGAKAFILKCTLGSCTIKMNGGTDVITLALGGYLLYANPLAGQLTALTITTTGAATLKILAVA